MSIDENGNKLITKIIKSIKDEDWASIEKLAEEVPFKEEKLERIISKLEEMDLIKCRDEEEKVKLREFGSDLLDLPMNEND